jgi:DNA-binding PadR family transcriptional regulator
MSLRHTLLALLDWIPLHGYALRDATRGFAWLHPMTNANIYPALRQLESEGFIQHRQEVVEGRLRKIYSTTEAGQQELRRWLGDATEQSGVYRDPALLKISLLRPGSFASARGWIVRDLERMRAGIERTERFLADRVERIPKYTRRVAEHGVELAKLRVRFLQEVLGEIDADVAASGDAPAAKRS